MSRESEIPPKSTAIIDSSVLFAMGGPDNEKYSAFEEFVTGRGLRVKVPEQVAEELGSVDVLVHNTAVRSGGPITHCDPEQFENVWRVRAYGGFLCAQEAITDMKEAGGTILFTGTSFALDGAAQMVDWGSAGFATRGLARSLADDLSDDGIQVTYAAIHAQVATEDDERGATAVRASDVAETFWELADNDTAITTELDIRPRGSG